MLTLLLDVVVRLVNVVSVVLEVTVAVRLVRVEVAVVVSHTYSYGGAVVYFGMAVLCGGSVVQHVAWFSS